MRRGVYKRRSPEKTDLYQITYRYFEEYEKEYRQRYEYEYGSFRNVIRDTIWRYLDCGILEHGFARVRCAACGFDYLVAFSCKTRFFCPSCAQKRTLIWERMVLDKVLRNVPHRQWVFTIPRVLRKLFYKERRLLAGLARCAAATLLELFAAVCPDRECRPGIIASTQTFGDLLVWHPHIHCLVTDGVFDVAGGFHLFPQMDADQAAVVFREKVFAMMRENNRISEGLMERMRNWRHSGFSVHNGVRIRENDPEALGRLAQYVVHASFAAEKIRYVEASESVIYKSKMHKGRKRNFEVMDAIEFLHRVCLHIPDPYEAMIRYYGHYANAARGKRRKLGLEESVSLVVLDDMPDRKECRRAWARLIYQVYEVDPLKCPRCGKRMKLIAFIQDRHEVVRILKHLGLWPIEYPSAAPARASPHDADLFRKRASSSLLE